VLREQIIERFPEQRLLRNARFRAERLQAVTLCSRDERGDRHEIHGLAILCFGALLGSHFLRLTRLL
jgi:hypothetical protein